MHTDGRDSAQGPLITSTLGWALAAGSSSVPSALLWHKQQSLQLLSDKCVLLPVANASEHLALHMEGMAFTLGFSSSRVMFDIIHIFNRILHEQKNEDHILH